MTASRGIGRGRGGQNRGAGKGAAWVLAHKDYAGDDCLAWPFSRCNGYANFIGYNGRTLYAYRFMCELANGPAPSPKHHAAHCVSRAIIWRLLNGVTYKTEPTALSGEQ